MRTKVTDTQRQTDTQTHRHTHGETIAIGKILQIRITVIIYTILEEPMLLQDCKRYKNMINYSSLSVGDGW